MRGTSLVECAIALAILGMLAGIAAPRAGDLRNRLRVERQAAVIVEGYQRARLTALLGARRAMIRVQPEEVSVWRLEDGDSALVWRERGATGAGVTLAGPARVVFAPSGLTSGLANGTWTLTRGGVSRSVVASRLGRLRVVAPRRRRRRRGPGAR